MYAYTAILIESQQIYNVYIEVKANIVLSQW